MEKRKVVSVSVNNSFQKCDRKRGSRSEMILRGKPCNLTMLSRKSLAKSGASICVCVGMKCAILEKRSTTTKMALNVCDCGKCTIRSIEMSCHGSSGGCSGMICPNGKLWRGFAIWHCGHVRVKSSMSRLRLVPVKWRCAYA